MIIREKTQGGVVCSERKENMGWSRSERAGGFNALFCFFVSTGLFFLFPSHIIQWELKEVGYMRNNIGILYHSVIDVQSQSNFKVSIFESTGLLSITAASIITKKIS